MKSILKYFLFTAVFLSFTVGFAQQSLPSLQTIHSRAHAMVQKLGLVPLGRMDSAAKLNLVLGLALRNENGLKTLIQKVYDPTSPLYHHFLSPSQFTAEFSLTAADYQTVIAFAQSNGMKITGTHADRILLGVSATVAEIQRAFHVNMMLYKDPAGNRNFYAPDADPSVDPSVPLTGISGLTDYEIPRPAGLAVRSQTSGYAAPTATTGSGPHGSYMGNDFRAAYANGVSLDGHGQKIGLMELFDPFSQSADSIGFYPNDISA